MSFTNRLAEVAYPIFALEGSPLSGPAGVITLLSPVAVPTGFQRFALLVNVGSMGAPANLGVTLFQANGTGFGATQKIIPGKTFFTDFSGQDKVYSIEVRAEELDLAGGFDAAVNYQFTNTGATITVVSAIYLGIEPRHAETLQSAWGAVID